MLCDSGKINKKINDLYISIVRMSNVFITGYQCKLRNLIERSSSYSGDMIVNWNRLEYNVFADPYKN